MYFKGQEAPNNVNVAYSNSVLYFVDLNLVLSIDIGNSGKNITQR